MNWFVGVTAVNAWRLMRVNQDPDLPYLKFLRGLVMEVLSKHGKKKERTGFPVTVRGREGDSLRRDAGHHMIVVSRCPDIASIQGVLADPNTSAADAMSDFALRALLRTTTYEVTVTLLVTSLVQNMFIEDMFIRKYSCQGQGRGL